MVENVQRFELKGKSAFVKAVIKPPMRMPVDMSNDACFYFMKSGQGVIFTPNEKVTVKKDEGVVLQCGKYINEYLRQEDYEYCEAIAIHLYPDVLKEIIQKDFPEFLTQTEETQLAHEIIQSSSLLDHYVQSLDFYFNNPQLVSDDLLRLKLKELLLLLAKTNNAGIIKTLINGAFDHQITDFRTIIEANLLNDLSLQELATLTNLSLSSFKREFEKHFDDSPARYFKKKKLEHAAKLLKSTEMRISDVAFESGFNDLAGFSKSFHKEFGVSPSDYR